MKKSNRLRPKWLKTRKIRTLRSFYKALKRVNGMSAGIHMQCIRLYDGAREYCPLTAVCSYRNNKKYGLGSYRKAGRTIGLSNESLKIIQLGADNLTSRNPRIRKESKMARRTMMKIFNFRESSTA